MSKQCSICLSKRSEKVIISEDIIIDKERKSYNEIIQLCLGIQVSDVSAVLAMCMKCNKKLISFYKFKTLALKSLNFMQSLCKVEIKKCSETVKQEESFEYQEDASEYNNELECPVTPEPEDVGVDTTQIKNEKDDSDNELIWNIKKRCGSNIDTDFETTLNNKTDIKTESKPKRKPIRKKRQVCEDCGKLVSNLEKHLKSHNLPGTKKFPCDQCDRTYASRNGRKKHIKSEHLGIRFICKICGKNVRHIKAHMLTVHNRVDHKHCCNICGVKFRSAYNLKTHEMTHSTDKIECDLCLKKYSSILSLNSHKRNVHQKEKCHLCQYCSKAFFKKYHLEQHLRSHSDERAYVCGCGKSFKMQSSLAEHLRTHDDCGKQYTCDYCNMTFPLKKRLTAHIITHMKLKPHACRFCATRFSRSDHRLRHERTAHLKYMPFADNK